MPLSFLNKLYNRNKPLTCSQPNAPTIQLRYPLHRYRRHASQSEKSLWLDDEVAYISKSCPQLSNNQLLGREEFYASKVIEAFDLINPKKIGSSEFIGYVYCNLTKSMHDDKSRQTMYLVGVALEFFRIALDNPRTAMAFFKQATFTNSSQYFLLAKIFKHVWEYTHGAGFRPE